jgi:uncharacterized protein (DUF1786 family)
MSLLAIDVGAGTQDILLFRPGVPAEGSVKMVLPSQTVIVAGKIDRARGLNKDIFIRGPTMGGGACAAAVRRHLEAGLAVYATPAAAATINDNLERVAGLGIRVGEAAPPSAQLIETGDLDLTALARAFELFDLSLPREIAVAVQDHGFSPHRSNRLARFEHMAAAMEAGGSIEAFAYRHPPSSMTRMHAVKSILEAGGFSPLLMDTGPAAIFGASQDGRCLEPALIVNLGNGHTIAAILWQGGITALFEHHTRQLTPQKLDHLLAELCRGGLESEEVYMDGGHGAFIKAVPPEVRSVLVTGPRRGEFPLSGRLRTAVAAAPAGDMMITGCLGLVEAWKRKDSLWR